MSSSSCGEAEFGHHCSADVPFLAVLGLVLSTVVGVVYPPDFAISLRFSGPGPSVGWKDSSSRQQPRRAEGPSTHGSAPRPALSVAVPLRGRHRHTEDSPAGPE